MHTASPFLSALLSAWLVAAPLSAQDAKDASAKPAAAQAVDKTALRKEAQRLTGESDFAGALPIFRKLTELDPKDAGSWHMLGYCLHATGKLDEALPVHLKAAEFRSARAAGFYNAACVYGLKKDAAQAAVYLEKAIAAGYANVPQYESDTDFDAVRKDPALVKLVEKMRVAATDPARQTQTQLFQAATPRKAVHYLLFSSVPEKSGQFQIEYGTPPWKEAYAKVANDRSKDSARWRLGQDFWTTLDNNVPMTLGGTKLAPGAWYLTLQCKDGKVLLQLHDSVAVRKARIDAFNCPKLTGGIEVPLTASLSETVAANLEFTAEADGEDQNQGKLTIAFGPHRLEVPFALDLSADAAATKR